jgi:glycine betaine/proline transport system substrate-binding protein
MRHIYRVGLIAVLALSLGLVSLVGAQDDAEDQLEGEIRMSRATWTTGWFQAAIFEQMLTELGYDVEIIGEQGAVDFYATAAEGEDVDMWANGWLPLHTNFMTVTEEDEEGRLPTLGRVIPVGFQVENGALQGYLIDRATAEEFEITSIADMEDPEVAALFDTDGNGAANLTGCNEGWGCAETINTIHLPEFELEEAIDHVQGDYALLMGETIQRYERGEPVFFYTWTPNWTINELEVGEDVVWLTTPELDDVEALEGVPGCVEDPCQMGFIGNDIRAVANTDFLLEKPAVGALMSVVEIPLSDIAEQNVMMRAGADSDEDIAEQAAEWIDDNRDEVDEWLAFARDNADNTELIEEFLAEWLAEVAGEDTADDEEAMDDEEADMDDEEGEEDEG